MVGLSLRLNLMPNSELVNATNMKGLMVTTKQKNLVADQKSFGYSNAGK